ncbi:hypothetical protein E3V39_09495 [Gammaproteobacteria bacterium LSUCC0112]|nr:hypothetical protein E3V39_09495 [Gammaproteobacteria bacterium LSUCC0112]
MDQPSTESGTSGSGSGGVKSDLSASLAWFQSLITMIGALLRLAIAELSLAREDLGRMIMGALLFIPLLLMTWVALTVLAAWIIYEQTASATLGITMFAAIHVVAVVVLYKRLNTYRRSLSLPVTRAQLTAILDEIRRERGQP